MRILHVIRSLDPHCGGPPAVLRSLLPEQVRRGHDVTILTTTKQAAGQAEHASTEEFQDAMRRDPAFDGAEIYFIHAFGRKKPWATFAYAPGARRWLRRRFADATRRPDVVHVHEVFVHLNMTAASEARRASIPCIVAPYGCLDSGSLRLGSARLKQAFSHLVVQKVLRNVAILQTTSHGETAELSPWIPRDIVRLVPHGASMPEGDPVAARDAFWKTYPETRGRRLIASVARIHPIKRLHLAIETLAKLRETNPEFMLVIAGRDAGDLSRLRGLVQHLGLEDSVLFPGFVEGELKEGLLAASELFLLPSSHENFGLVVVEAMARGLPSVVTPEVASHVYLEECRGGVAVAATADALAEAVQAVLKENDPERPNRLKQYVQRNLSWETAARQTDDLYQEAIAKTRFHAAP